MVSATIPRISLLEPTILKLEDFPPSYYTQSSRDGTFPRGLHLHQQHNSKAATIHKEHGSSGRHCSKTVDH